MKRDMDLVRKILITIEDQDLGFGLSGKVRIDDVDERLLQGHLNILADAGLIECRTVETLQSGPFYEELRLSWRGHEFLANARNETIWNQAKEMIG